MSPYTGTSRISLCMYIVSQFWISTGCLYLVQLIVIREFSDLSNCLKMYRPLPIWSQEKIALQTCLGIDAAVF